MTLRMEAFGFSVKKSLFMINSHGKGLQGLLKRYFK
jgi:hypothetical protein